MGSDLHQSVSAARVIRAVEVDKATAFSHRARQRLNNSQRIMSVVENSLQARLATTIASLSSLESSDARNRRTRPLQLELRTLGELLLAAHQCSDSFREQVRIERLAESFREQRSVETAGVIIVAQQTD